MQHYAEEGWQASTFGFHSITLFNFFNYLPCSIDAKLDVRAVYSRRQLGIAVQVTVMKVPVVKNRNSVSGQKTF